MPEDDPGTLTRDASRRVAAYVHEAFYSPIARARNRPARIELARLTVRQYRETVADLIGSFRQPTDLGDERGLRGEYYRERSPRSAKDAVVTRIDPQINFDFGTEAAVSELDTPHAFSIRWAGSLLVPETGEYTFQVRTEHAVRLWVNDPNTPAIDAWVKSGEQTEFEASRFLLGGRVYPLRLEFTKAKQGVDDSKKRSGKPPSARASMGLLWQRPHSVMEFIPDRHLSPSSSPESYVCSTRFPPDDGSYGWQRGTSVSKAWDEATTLAAIETATYISSKLSQLAGTRENAADREQKLRAFCQEFAERAFRMPLDEETEDRFITRQFNAASAPELAVRRIVLLVLKSPRFLFREVGAGPEGYHVAARLSYGLWDSLPDQPLLDAAKAGQLTTQSEVRQHAERMLMDRRASTKLEGFLLNWLNVDSALDLSKDSEKLPGFDAVAIADLRTSLELYLNAVVSSESADFRQLLLADEVFLNQRLRQLYGVESSPTKGYEKVQLENGKRAGVLTHPYVMARFAHRSESSPIHRGVFLTRSVLGQTLRPPPEAVAPLATDLHPDLTTRERVTLQTKAARCMTCHSIINPLGFTLERYDAVGRYRDLDRGKPVDDSAVYLSRDGQAVTLRGARELAEYLVAEEACHTAFAEQLFQHLAQQPVRAYGVTTLDELRQAFVAAEFNIRKLAVEVLTASALVGRETSIVIGERTCQSSRLAAASSEVSVSARRPAR